MSNVNIRAWVAALAETLALKCFSNGDGTGTLAVQPVAAAVASETLLTPSEITKTVAASGTPEALAADGTFFHVAKIKAIKASRAANTGTVYLGCSSSNDSQPIELGAGDEITIDVGVNGAKLDLNDFYLDVATNGDGVTIQYW